MYLQDGRWTAACQGARPFGHSFKVYIDVWISFLGPTDLYQWICLQICILFLDGFWSFQLATIMYNKFAMPSIFEEGFNMWKVA